MPDTTEFLTVMAAMSAAVQTFVYHVIKRRITWLDTATPEDLVNERRRHGTIHLVSFVVGFLLAWSVGLNPLSHLGVSQGPIANSLAAGLLVSFGGSFFNEALGAVREFKKAQEEVEKKLGSERLARAPE